MQSASRDWAIAFSRYPQPGRTKTRLIPALGARGAAWFQRLMTERTLATLRDWQAAGEAGRRSLELRYVGGTVRQFQRWLGTGLRYRDQGAGDLGDRLVRAFAEAFAAGAQRVAIVGIDCPELSAARLEAAFAALESAEVALGTATDGGYYLVALRASARERALPGLFADIDWGSDRVFAQTLERGRSQQLSIRALPPLPDIDRPEDLSVWDRATGRTAQRISVVIPTLNEGATLGETLARVRTGTNVEVVVADGGSQDETRQVARAAGATVVQSSPGRAQQLNAGARAATGEILLLLHADTRLPLGFDAIARQVLADVFSDVLSDDGTSAVVAGAFELSVAAQLPGLATVVRVANWRSRVLQLPYGDQGLFLRRDRFEALGGLPELPLMEDFEFARQLQRLGRIAIAPVPIVTSGRRWQRLGVLRTTLLNQIIVLAYLGGMSPKILADWYRKR